MLVVACTYLHEERHKVIDTRYLSSYFCSFNDSLISLCSQVVKASFSLHRLPPTKRIRDEERLPIFVRNKCDHVESYTRKIYFSVNPEQKILQLTFYKVAKLYVKI